MYDYHIRNPDKSQKFDRKVVRLNSKLTKMESEETVIIMDFILTYDHESLDCLVKMNILFLKK